MNEEEKLKLKEYYVAEITDKELSVQLQAINRTKLLAESLGVNGTQNFIIPLLDSIASETTSDELMVAISNEIKNLVPYIGGVENSLPLLHILTSFGSADETLVRQAMVEAIVVVTRDFSYQLMTEHILPIIIGLIKKEWTFSKCTALSIAANTYTKFNQESQLEIRTNLISCFHDTYSPVVRKAASECLTQIMEVLQKDVILNEFIPVLDILLKDSVDSVSITTVPLCVAIGKRMSADEVREHLIKILDGLRSLKSWKIDCALASHLADLLSISDSEDHLNYMYNLFIDSVNNCEVEVEIVAVENIYSFFKAIKENCDKGGRDFDAFFVQQFIIFEKLMFTAEGDVKVALSKSIILFGELLSAEVFKNYLLPNIITWIQNEEKMSVQENILLHLNKLPKDIDLGELINALANIVKSLILKSNLHWRSRRNILLSFVYLGKFITKEQFAEKFKIFYSRLISDKIFAVRRTATLILPILAQYYGIDWLSKNIIPQYMVLSSDHRYLYTYMPLFCINELISPTLEEQNNETKTEKYLKDYKQQLQQPKVLKSLYKINKLFNKIKPRLEEEAIQQILVSGLPNYPKNNDEISLYAEETLAILKESYTNNFCTVSDNLECPYLEGILILIYRDFLNIIVTLSTAKTDNLRIYAKYTMNNIKKFLEKLNSEINQGWVKEALGKVGNEDAEELNKEIVEKLSLTLSADLDLDLVEETESLPDLGKLTIPEFEIDNVDLESTSFVLEDDDNNNGKGVVEDTIEDVLDEMNSIIDDEEKSKAESISADIKESVSADVKESVTSDIKEAVTADVKESVTANIKESITTEDIKEDTASITTTTTEQSERSETLDVKNEDNVKVEEVMCTM